MPDAYPRRSSDAPFRRCWRPSICARLVRLDEDKRVALADGGDLGALAGQAGHELQGVAGQGAARAALDGVRDGLGAFVVGAGAAEFPAAGPFEGLVEDS